MSNKSPLRITPVPRVEGDIDIEVDIKDGRIKEARVSGILFRGFEKLLCGRDPMDALVFAPRICGICSLGQSTAAADLLGNFYGVEMPPNAYHIRNILLASEIVMNHLTHFYLLFGRDLVHPRFNAHPLYEELKGRFSGTDSMAAREALLARRRILEIVGLLGGKWPNSLALQPGGVTRSLNSSDIIRALGVCRESREWLERRLLGGPMEGWLEVTSLAEAEKWLNRQNGEASDLALFISLARTENLAAMGQGPGRFLSFGGFRQPEGGHLFPAGVFDGGKRPLEAGLIGENVSHTWLQGSREELIHPARGETRRYATREEAYSWAKAPRYDGKPAETGPLARMLLADNPLIRDAFSTFGSTILTRMLARMQELVIIIKEMEAWLNRIDPIAPYYTKHASRGEGEAAGMCEVSRGSLGHWMRVKNGVIAAYQIITPSTWHFSPRDAAGLPGPLESALVGTEVRDPNDPVEPNLIVRSFDPCLFCTVHSVRFHD